MWCDGTFLNARHFQDREIVPMNFGISGYGTAQAIEVMRHVVWDYDPDLVVLGFVANDFTDNHRAWGGSDIKPFYVFDEEGSLVLDDSFLSSADFKARTSTLPSAEKRSRAAISILAAPVVEIRAALERKPLVEARPRRKVGGLFFRPPEEARVQEAWRGH